MHQSTSTGALMSADLRIRLQRCLFFCRVAVFIVFMVWTLNKLLRPEHGVGIMRNFYLIPGLSEALILAFAVFELVMCFLFVMGYYKRFTRGFFLFLAFMSFATPRAVNGMKNGILDGWHTIMFFSAFCLFACALIGYIFRDEDTWFSLADSRRNQSDEGAET